MLHALDSAPLFLVLAVAATAVATASAADLPLAKRVYTDKDGHKLPYRLMQPEGFDPKAATKYPLVIFLHGAGERGTDNEKQLVHGVPEFARSERRKAYPCFLIAPQCPDGKKWCEVDWSAPSHKQPETASEPLRLTMELVASLGKEFPLDERRLYITGLSMGGYGTWDAIARYPDKFAAAAPVCGGGDETTAAKIAKLPIWNFHGDKDTAVPVARSRNMIEAIKKAGGEPKYTEYPNEGHASWVPAYRDEDLYKWLFAQKRK